MLRYGNYSGIIYAVMLFPALFFVTGSVGYAQNAGSFAKGNDISEAEVSKSSHNRSYSITLHNVTVKKALEMIAREDDLRLAYCPDYFKEPEEITVRDSDMSLQEVLKRVLDDTGLTYKITDTRHLVIFKKNDSRSAANTRGTLKGNIIDGETGSPLYGSEVILKTKRENNTGSEDIIVAKTFVDSEGRYDMHDIESGSYQLVILYGDQKKIVENIVVEDEVTVSSFKITNAGYN